MKCPPLLALASLSSLFSATTALHGLKAKLKSNFDNRQNSQSSASSPGVFLSSFSSPAEAQAAAKVDFSDLNWDQEQYAGYLTFTGDRGANATSPVINSFFWLFESLDGNIDAPILIWLQGGPGGSSLYGAFEEIGAMGIDENGDIYNREELNNWNQHYALLIIDNPVGVGFSFSNDKDCYVTDEKQVGSDLYSAMQEFYKSFPERRSSELYITGESYAGKYIPALGYTIMTNNQKNDPQQPNINLKGVSIGDGAMNPPTQFLDYGNLLFYAGMADQAEREIYNSYEDKIKDCLSSNDDAGNVCAFEQFDEMLNGDFYPYPTFYTNHTGLTNYFNFEQGDCGSCDVEKYGDWVTSDDVRNRIGVGNIPYFDFNETVEENLKEDWMRGVVDMLVPLMESKDIKVLIYSGQNDIILGPPLTENFLNSLEWSGSDQWKSSEKQVWSIKDSGSVLFKNDPVAGYSTSVSDGTSYWGFEYKVVRGAGHMVPLDQPERTYNMITEFVSL